jgi:hypothetical protein
MLEGRSHVTKVQIGVWTLSRPARNRTLCIRKSQPFLLMRISAFGDRIAPVSRTANMPEERRRTLRFKFEATAEVSQENSQARIPARVTEISLNGCFLQMAEPFPEGTPLLVKIFVEGSFFEAHAKVANSQPKIGVGVAFRDLKPYFVNVLKKWLLEAMLAKNTPPA